MAQTGYTPIVTYNTATAAAVPTAPNLQQGELAVNVTDKKLYTKDSGGAVVQVGSGPDTAETLSNKYLTSSEWGSGPINGAAIGAFIPSTARFTTLTTTGNVTLGDAAGDAITINGTSTFNNPITITSALSAQSTLDVTGNLTTGNTAQLKIGAFGSYVRRMYEADGTLLIKSAQGSLVLRSSSNVDTSIAADGSVTFGAQFGYGTGAGGAVTQTTNKSTSVTLNKPSGQITMNGASMATNEVVVFALSNSYISLNDVVMLSQQNTLEPYAFPYQFHTKVYAGGVFILVKNISGGTIATAPVINFAVIKGSAS